MVRLGDLLIQEGAITQEQLDKALDFQKENPKTRIGEALVTLEFLDMKTLVATLAKQEPPPGVTTPDPGQQDASVKEAPPELSQAMKLGQILLREKVVTPEQLQKAVAYQQENPGTKLGKAIIDLGLTTEETIANALRKQPSEQEPQPEEDTPPDEPGKPLKLGEILVKKNVITEEQLQKALEYQQQYQGTMLGQAIIDLGFASDKTISSALNKQRRGSQSQEEQSE